MKRLIHVVAVVATLSGAVRADGQAHGSWDSFTATTVVKGFSVTVNGWGADAVSGTSGVVANVYVDGAFMVQQPVGNVHRPDVASAFGRNDFAWSGYAATFSTANLSQGTHTVDIWVGGGPSGWNHFTASIVNGSTFTVTPPQVYGAWESLHGGTVYRGAPVTVSGWIADSLAGTSGLAANVYVDGVFAAQVYPSAARSDVASSYGRSDFLHSGFSATLDTSNLSTGVHAIDIWMGGGPGGWLHATTSMWNGGSFTVLDPPGTVWHWHDLWTNGYQSPPPAASNGRWTAQYDYVADPAADEMPNLGPSSPNLHTFSTSQVGTLWGQQVFARDLAGHAANGPTQMHTHPAWAMDKTFTAPVAGWYHLRAENITRFGCGADWASDGVLLEVYHVTSAGETRRLWATLLTGNNCDPALISLNQYLAANEKLIVRGASHTGENAQDGINIDPYVQLITSSSAYGPQNPPCSTTPAGNTIKAINDAIAAAGSYVGNTTWNGLYCPRAEVILSGTYGTSVAHPERTIRLEQSHVTVRGDAGGTRAVVLLDANRDIKYCADGILFLKGVASEVRGVDFKPSSRAKLPFTQGSVSSLTATGFTFQVDKSSGYDFNLGQEPWSGQSPKWLWTVLFSGRPDASNRPPIVSVRHAILSGCYDTSSATVCTASFPVNHPLSAAEVDAANFHGTPSAAMALRNDTAGCGLIEADGRENALTDVTLTTSPGLGVRSDGATGLHLRRFKIQPEADQLISTGADGVYLIGLRRGATIEDSVFDGLADDGLNNHVNAREVNAPYAPWEAQPKPEDRWIVWDSGLYLKTTVPSAGPAGLCGYAGCLGFNISASGEGTLIRRNVYRNIRGYGVRNDAGHTLISRNSFKNIFSVVTSTNAWGRYLDSETDLNNGGEGPYAYNFFARKNCVTATWTYFGSVPLTEGDFFDWENWKDDNNNDTRPSNFWFNRPLPTLSENPAACPW